MEWYAISNATGKEVGNVYPQVESMAPGYDLKKPESVHNMPFDKFPDFEPDLSYFVLEKKAKLTDVISTGYIIANGFLISEKLKNQFEKFNLPEHRYYPARVLYKNTLHNNYYWMHFANDCTSLLDFDRSTFKLTHPLPFFREGIKHISAKNADELRLAKNAEASNEIFFDKIKLKKGADPDLDMLFFDFPWRKFYINEKLMNNLTDLKITGFQYDPIDAEII